MESSNVKYASSRAVGERYIDVAGPFVQRVVGGSVHGKRGDPRVVRENDGTAIALVDVNDDEHVAAFRLKGHLDAKAKSLRMQNPSARSAYAWRVPPAMFMATAPDSRALVAGPRCPA